MHPTNCNLTRIYFIALLCGPVLAFSQSTLKGKVTDSKTGEPVPYANVFFNNTTIGNATTVDGSYQIKNIPPGKFDLTISVIGYTRFQKSMEFPGLSELNIKLSPDPVELSTVTIEADKSDNKKYFHVFSKYFLGESLNARSSVIKNPETVHLYYDQSDKVLTGHASQPIVVENIRLGYRLYYLLDNFVLDYKGDQVSLFGVPRFEELPVDAKKDSSRREKRRLEAYSGSLTHFMRSLYANSLKGEGFKVTWLKGGNVGTGAYQGEETPIDPATFLTGVALISKVFQFKGTLKVEYRNEFEPQEYRRSRNSSYQISFITFRNDRLSIFQNGFYTDPTSIYLEGFLGWSEKIGELMPLSYYPPPAKGKKK